jgi:hypothetical protein
MTPYAATTIASSVPEEAADDQVPASSRDLGLPPMFTLDPEPAEALVDGAKNIPRQSFFPPNSSAQEATGVPESVRDSTSQRGGHGSTDENEFQEAEEDAETDDLACWVDDNGDYACRSPGSTYPSSLPDGPQYDNDGWTRTEEDILW